MAERLKDQFFTSESLGALAEALLRHCPPFDRDGFFRVLFGEGWEELELKDRMRRTARAMHAALPQTYSEALEVLCRVAPEVGGFEAMALPDFVEQFGRHDWDRSLNALGFFTRFGSAEFAIRPFLDTDPERGMAQMVLWAEDDHPAVRRLASEGCRPRLPWAMALPRFREDPSLILPILEKLKGDPDEAVRRSVANNLNDISKDHPDLVLDLCEGWKGESGEVDAVVKHACRTLLKAGNSRAMLLFGFEDPAHVRVDGLWCDRSHYAIGDDVEFGFDLEVGGEDASLIRLEYAVDFARARGRTGRKVFSWSEVSYDPGRYTRTKRHSMVDMSTRTHYPGSHRVTVIVNGMEKASVTFDLTDS